LTTTTQFEDGVVNVTLDLTSVVELLAAMNRRHPPERTATGGGPMPESHQS
jgi:hypothetical protein